MISRLAERYEDLCRAVLLVMVVNAAMVVYTLRGLIVIGFFPAVGAAVSTYRRWYWAEDKRWGIVETWNSFSGFWREDMIGANASGYLLTLVWLVLIVDYRVLSVVQLGIVGPVVAGVLIVVSVFMLVFTAVFWPVRATFDEPWLWHMRCSATVVLGRPLCSVIIVAEAFVLLWAFLHYPAIVVAAGVAAMLFLATITTIPFAKLPRDGGDVEVFRSQTEVDVSEPSMLASH